MMEYIRTMVRQEVERVTASRKHPRNAKVTSYDPKTYSAKVKFEPHDPNDENNAESGWIPIQAMATGAGFGIYSAPNIGDPVEVGFQEGDHMTARIQQRHVSEEHQPPEGVEAGEHHMVHGSGAVIRMKKDGTVFLGGAGTVKRRKGKSAEGGSGGSGGGQSGQAQSDEDEQPQALQGVTLHPNGRIEIKTPKGNFEIMSDHEYKVAAKKAVSITSDDDITIKPGGKIYLG